MGKVIAIVKIFPESTDVDLNVMLESIKKEIGGDATISDTRIEDIAFGLKVLKLALIVPEVEGALEGVEEKIRNVKGVSEVEIEGVTRL
ncbi:MAG: elongation factor 1-beta [Candidatus Baldrarchaeia archaeon]